MDLKLEFVEFVINHYHNHLLKKREIIVNDQIVNKQYYFDIFKL